MYKNFLFDLDGTLLPMDMKYFIDLYVAAFCKSMVPVTKIESKPLMNAIWTSVAQMAKNDGDCLNIDIFWRTMNSVCRRDMRVFNDDFDSFYRGEFSVCRAATKVQPLARIVVDYIRQRGGNIIVSTNPIFPDNSSACKPNLNYFEEICSVCGIHPEESIVIGNDVDEDMISSRLGFDTYLVTDCLINRYNKELTLFRNGSFGELFDFIQDSYKQK